MDEFLCLQGARLVTKLRRPLHPSFLVAVPVSLALVGLLLLAPLALAGTFSDVPASYPYATAIADLSNRDIIHGFPDGTFRPGDPVSRQQFAKMIVKSLGLAVTGSEVCPFSDVSGGLDPSDPLYPDKYVAVCAAQGITLGKTPTTFAPYDHISRFQLLSMVVRGVNSLLPGRLSDPPAGYVSTWDPGLSLEHGQNARLAEYNDLLVGLPLGSLDPWGDMPRGEVAQVLHDLFAKLPHYEHLAGDLSWTPLAISDEPGALEVFARTSSGQLREYLYYSGQWQSGMNLGGNLAGRPAGVARGPNQLDVFARGANDELLHWTRTVSGGWQPVESLGGQLGSDPDVIAPATGNLHVFVRGSDGDLWHRFHSDSLGWYPWEDLGAPSSGPLMSAPTAVWWGDGLDVYVCGSDGQLWHRGWAGYWHDWESLEGTIQGRPAAVSWGYGRVDVFAWDTQNVLAHWYWDGAWHPFDYHGGCYSSPSVVSWGLDHLDIYARYADGSLFHVYFHGAWSDDVYLGGQFEGAPSAVAWGPGRIDVFGWGLPNNNLAHWWYDGSW